MSTVSGTGSSAASSCGSTLARSPTSTSVSAPTRWAPPVATAWAAAASTASSAATSSAMNEAGRPVTTAAVVLGGAGPVSLAPVAGTYRVAATVEIDSPGLPERHELRADVVLGPWPGSAPGTLSVTPSSAGHRCTLAARLDRAGAMEPAAGQRCRIALQEEAVSGLIDCTLRVGRGQVRGGRLSLELGADLRGLLCLGPADR